MLRILHPVGVLLDCWIFHVNSNRDPPATGAATLMQEPSETGSMHYYANQVEHKRVTPMPLYAYQGNQS